mmetsp:Transcript_44661/g.105823  ORF Transcript_44661/g.105823 Transcript_44661/m.105823 type:complete len:321 (-) Transcript_44661:521-1483(-)
MQLALDCGVRRCAVPGPRFYQGLAHTPLPTGADETHSYAIKQLLYVLRGKSGERAVEGLPHLPLHRLEHLVGVQVLLFPAVKPRNFIARTSPVPVLPICDRTTRSLWFRQTDGLFNSNAGLQIVSEKCVGANESGPTHSCVGGMHVLKLDCVNARGWQFHLCAAHVTALSFTPTHKVNAIIPHLAESSCPNVDTCSNLLVTCVERENEAGVAPTAIPRASSAEQHKHSNHIFPPSSLNAPDRPVHVQSTGCSVPTSQHLILRSHPRAGVSQALVVNECGPSGGTWRGLDEEKRRTLCEECSTSANVHLPKAELNCIATLA